MEHRWSQRKTCQSSVTAHSPFRGTAIGRIRDIGLGGMFIETGTLLFAPHAPIHVKFSLHESSGVFRFESVVVRRTAYGIGIMFLDVAPDIVAALHRALYTAPAEQLTYMPLVLRADAGALTQSNEAGRAMSR